MKIRFNHCGPQFIVRDMSNSLKFYSSVLGFKIDYQSGSPPKYTVVYRDEVYLHLSVKDSKYPYLGPGRVFIVVDEVDRLWAQINSSDVNIIDNISDQDYGSDVRFRVFTITDLDYNVLRIGQKL